LATLSGTRQKREIGSINLAVFMVVAIPALNTLLHGFTAFVTVRREAFYPAVSLILAIFYFYIVLEIGLMQHPHLSWHKVGF